MRGLLLGLLGVVGAIGAFAFGGSSRRLIGGKRYRATFAAPPALTAALSVGGPSDTGPAMAIQVLRNLKGLFPGGASLGVSDDRKLVTAVFVAPKDAELDDPSTPLKGDVPTPLGPLVLRKLEVLS